MKSKITLPIILIFFCLKGYSQKDTTINLIPDTLNIISISDLNATLKDLENKITKLDYDKAQSFFQMALNQALIRRNKIKR